jgi:hypothetical protein
MPLFLCLLLAYGPLHWHFVWWIWGLGAALTFFGEPRINWRGR